MDITSRKQVKIGALLSYFMIFINTFSAVLMTPFLIGRIGESDYGVYKSVTSLAATLTVIDFGLGSTVQRFVSGYLSENKKNRLGSFFSHSLLASIALNAILLMVSSVIFALLENIYGSSFDIGQISDARIIFVISSVSIFTHIFEGVFFGMITGHNRFIFINTVKLLSIIIRIALFIVFTEIRPSAIGLVVISLVVDVCAIATEIIYTKTVLKIKWERVNWSSFKKYLKMTGGYTSLMFITTIISQICLNMDNTIIGAIRGPELVTIYSVGIMIYLMFSELSCSISSVMLPTVTKTLQEQDGEKKVVGLIIQAGRLQFMLLGAAIVGFVCVGREFLHLWLGEGYEDVYVITLILIVPALFELCVNTCLSVLQAKNKLGFRTIALGISSVINAVITIILVKEWSYIGAAIGTAVSYVLCSLIAMNLYYHFRLEFNMIQIYKGILHKIWLCLLLSGGTLYFVSYWLEGGWMLFCLKVAIFVIVYGALLYFIGFTKEDKNVLGIWKKIS